MNSQTQRLRHSSDSEPGYTRRRQGHAWAYYDEHDKRVTNRAEIDRLNAIARPLEAVQGQRPGCAAPSPQQP